LSRIGSGLLTLRELKRGNLLDALRHADDEEDINKVLRWHIQIKNLQPISHLCKSFLSLELCVTPNLYHFYVGISRMNIFTSYTASSGSLTRTTISLLIKKILSSTETMR
jgi:hypothetical protein